MPTHRIAPMARGARGLMLAAAMISIGGCGAAGQAGSPTASHGVALGIVGDRPPAGYPLGAGDEIGREAFRWYAAGLQAPGR